MYGTEIDHFHHVLALFAKEAATPLSEFTTRSV
jgi:hypothetical protein